ncbi:MAG: hypothetical protein NVS4B9_31880 [Ktedonobacteraceae bacterium]
MLMEASMESTEILEKARINSETPYGWIVFPLLRNNVLFGIAGWLLGMLLGLGLFAALASIVIPYNYQHGVGPAIFSTILLGFLLFVGLGSAWALVQDGRRLLQAEKHLLVITPDAFVKQEGEKIIYVPLMYIRHVTARGARPPDRDAVNGHSDTAIPGPGENIMGFLAGRGFTTSGVRWRRRRMRTPTTLAFVDTRTDDEVTVATDGAYGDPFMIAALLKQYVSNAQNIA